MVKSTDHVELQSRLLQCVFCDGLSRYVVQGIKPGSRRRRTDMTLFGVCAADLHLAPMWCDRNGYYATATVEWEGLGGLVREMAAAGWVA